MEILDKLLHGVLYWVQRHLGAVSVKGQSHETTQRCLVMEHMRRVFLGHEGVHERCSPNLVRQVAFIHSWLLKEFGSIEVLNGKHRGACQVIWLDCCVFIYVV